MVTPAHLHRGDVVTPVESISGNYAEFYTLVAEAIATGGPAPVSLDDALQVAQLIERAREISVR
jgi:predicted dehydrogenase